MHKRFDLGAFGCLVALLGLFWVTPAAGAEDPAAIEPAAAPAPVSSDADASGFCGTLCKIIKAPGTKLYEDKESWFINSFNFVGRFQYQTAFLDGDDVNGDDYDEWFTDFRRVRFGAKLGFARYFKLKGNVNLVSDGRQSERNLDWGYSSFDELILSFDANKALDVAGLDELSFHYGRKKMLVGQEVHVSSKKIKTVERAGISNRAFPTRMTGGWFDVAKGPWSGTFGVFSTDTSRSIANWSGGEAYYLNVNYALSEDDDLIFDFLYNDANGEDDLNLVRTNQGAALYEWAASAAWDAKRGNWGLMANVIVGDNGDVSNSDREGLFYGFVVLPTYRLTERVELVGRYAAQFAELDEGIRTTSRYFRREARLGADQNGGRGNSHHAVYAGLNYYICGDNMKVMTGVEWQTLDTPDGNADGVTLWFAYRMYF